MSLQQMSSIASNAVDQFDKSTVEVKKIEKSVK